MFQKTRFPFSYQDRLYLPKGDGKRPLGDGRFVVDIKDVDKGEGFGERVGSPFLTGSAP